MVRVGLPGFPVYVYTLLISLIREPSFRRISSKKRKKVHKKNQNGGKCFKVDQHRIMNTLREYFGKFQTFSESQKWVVNQLTTIFPYHIQCGIEAVVGMQTVGILPFDSRVLLQQCIDFILDNGDILEIAVTEYMTSVTNLTGTAQHASGHSKKRKHQEVEYRNPTVIIYSDEEDEIRMLEAIADLESKCNNNQICNSKLNGSSSVDIKTSRIGGQNFVHNKFATAISVTKGNALTSAIGHAGSPASSMAKSKSSTVSSLNSNGINATIHSVPSVCHSTSATTIPNGVNLGSSFSFHTPVPATNPLMEGGGVKGSACLSSPSRHIGEATVNGPTNHFITTGHKSYSPLKHGPVGGVTLSGSASRSSTLGPEFRDHVIGPQTHFAKAGQISLKSLLGAGSRNHYQTTEQVGGVCMTGSSSQSFTFGHVGGVGVAGLSNQSQTLGHVVGMTGSSSQLSTLGDVDGVSVTEPSCQSLGSGHVGGTLTTPDLGTSLNTITSSALSVSSSPIITTVNSDVSVNKMFVPPKSKTEELEEMKEQVINLFPNADPTYVMNQLQVQYGQYCVNNVCSMMLENPDYPKVKTVAVCKNETPVEDKTDYFKDYDQRVCYYSEIECSRQLQNEFRQVSVRDIGRVLSKFNGHYAPAYRALFDAMEQAYKQAQDKILSQSIRRSPNTIVVTTKQDNPVVIVNLLKGKRPVKPLPPVDPQLQKEIDFVLKKLEAEKQEADEKFAWQLNENEYEDSGQMIECNCCFGEHPFESMVQCYDGHLFCRECLLSYAKEAVYGSGKLGLACMASDCDSSFPISEIKRSLPENLLTQYEERIRESNLNLADLKDLVRCPHCDYAAIMAPGDKVFKCQSQSCLKETCRYCQEEWSSHIGIPCNELEKKDESHLRKQYEEKMTEAKIRTCHRCKNKFTKDEGCNKMTCTCSATMCYICRKPNIDYNHFCGHPREPGHNCSKCTACSLWTKPDEDDNRAIKEIQNEANQKRKEKGYEENKLIGAPSEPPAKKKKF